MSIIKKSFDFYINSSAHVAISAYCLTRITLFSIDIKSEESVAYFVFFATFFAYNFVKYYAVFLRKYQFLNIRLKLIFLLSLISFLFAFSFFLEFKIITQIVVLVLLITTLIYAVPITSKYKNIRNLSGIKIYFVSFCWLSSTLFLPIIDSGFADFQTILLLAIQRFIFLFVLLLVFEIKDLNHDNLSLNTIPQQLGIKKTKILGVLLLGIFIIMSFYGFQPIIKDMYINATIAFVTMLFLLFAHPKNSKYYTSFFAESIPIVWFLLYYFLLLY